MDLGKTGGSGTVGKRREKRKYDQGVLCDRRIYFSVKIKYTNIHLHTYICLLISYK